MIFLFLKLTTFLLKSIVFSVLYEGQNGYCAYLIASLVSFCPAANTAELSFLMDGWELNCFRLLLLSSAQSYLEDATRNDLISSDQSNSEIWFSFVVYALSEEEMLGWLSKESTTIRVRLQALRLIIMSQVLPYSAAEATLFSSYSSAELTIIYG